MTPGSAGSGPGIERRPPYYGLPGQQLPVLTSAVRDCLGRLPVRQRLEQVEGRPLWLLRLGVTVLPHATVTGGCLCTVVAADADPQRLPVGVFVVEDVEIVTAVPAATCRQAPLSVQLGLSTAVVRDAWQVRLAVVDPRYRLMAALLDGVDPDTLTVIAGEVARRRSTSRTVHAFGVALARLCTMGFLVALDHPAAGVVPGCGGGARYGLRLPRPQWPRETAP